MISFRFGKILIISCLVLPCFCLTLAAQNDAYSQALLYLGEKKYDQARESFTAAAEEYPKAAYEYAIALIEGKLGQRDTTLGLFYLTDLACYGRSQGYLPFLKGEDEIFSDDKDQDESECQEKAISKIKSLPQNTGSDYLAIIYEAIGKAFGAEGDFIKAEQYFKKAAQAPIPSSYYYVQDPRLSLALFYLLIDGDYIEHQVDSEGGVPFENLGIVNSSSLRVYKYNETREANDNTTYWLEQFKKMHPEAMDNIRFTIMGYTLNDILYGIYEFGLPNNPKDHDKAMLIAGEMILTGNMNWFGLDGTKEVADYYYNIGRKSQAWEMYRIAKCDYGMGRCYYDERDFKGALDYLTKALSDYQKYSNEEVVDALSLVSSMYRYGRGVIDVNEQLADCLLDASRKYNSNKGELVLTFAEGRIVSVDLK